MKIFFLIILLLATLYFINKRNKNLINAKVPKKAIDWSGFVLTVGIFLAYKYSNNILGYALAVQTFFMLISMYRSLGIDKKGFNVYTGGFLVANIKFSNLEEVRKSQENDILKLQIKAKTTLYNLDFDKEKTLDIFKILNEHDIK